MIAGLLDIIIIRFNTPELDEKCVASVLKYVGNIPHVITIFDNSANKMTVTEVWNKLINSSHGEYVLLLNNDTEVYAGAIPKMMDTMLSRKDVGAVGPSTNNSKNPQRVEKYPTTKSEIDMKEKFGTDWQLSGFCLLLKRWAVQYIGGFDETYGHYGQENDLLYREQEAGFKTIWRQDAFVYHVGQASSKKLKGFNDMLERRKADRKYKLLTDK